MSSTAAPKRSLKSAKSRGGCQRCRAKRIAEQRTQIKCDENKPACNICLANGVRCPGFARQLRWSSKHEVFSQDVMDKKPTKASGTNSSTPEHSTRNARIIGQSPSTAHNGAFNVTQNEEPNSSMHWDGMDMSEMFEWPNFEFCGFNDLGLSTPVVGQETSAELDALSNASVSSHAHDQGSSAMAMAMPEGTGIVAPFNPFVEQPVVQHKSPKTGPRKASQSQTDTSISCIDSVSLLQTFYRLSMPSAVPGFSDQDFVHHYFNNICTIYSCFDSDLNPFRTYVSEYWSECRTTYLAIQAMSASHLANFYPHMAPMGLAKRSQAWLSLQRDLRQAREGKQESDRVLLGLLLLGLSSHWNQAGHLGLEYLFAARDIVQRKLRNPHGVRTEKDEFFLSALMHWEMLASFVDPVPLMPLSGLKSPEPKLPNAEGPRKPHPWTGVVKELHFVLAEIGRVLRRQRYLASASGLSAERQEDLRAQDEEWMVKLERMLLMVPHLELDDIVDYNDPKTPRTDLIRVTEAYRYTGLLEIYTAFPSILQARLAEDQIFESLATILGVDDEPVQIDKMLSNIASFILDVIRPISILSGACRLLPLVLLSCAGHVHINDDHPPDHGADPTRSDEPVEKRYFLEARMMTLSRKFPQKPLLQMMEIVKEVWVRLDSRSSGAHWMEVAHDNGWQTIFG